MTERLNETSEPKELTPEERRKLIDELNRVIREFTALVVVPEEKRTKEGKRKIAELAQRADEIEKQLSSF